MQVVTVIEIGNRTRHDYREGNLLGYLGWVDFDIGCSTICLILLGVMGSWQNWLSS